MAQLYLVPSPHRRQLPIPVSYIRRMLQEAAIVSRLRNDDRRFYIGAIGLRSDGTRVIAWNGNPKEPTRQHHCEYRLSRKLDRDSVVFITRTLSLGGKGLLGLARPCNDCQKVLSSKGVARAYYSINDSEWGCISFGKF